MQFISSLESLQSRASALNRYRYLTGTTDFLTQDLARYTNATEDAIKAAAAKLVSDSAGIIHVFPEIKSEGGE